MCMQLRLKWYIKKPFYFFDIEQNWSRKTKLDGDWFLVEIIKNILILIIKNILILIIKNILILIIKNILILIRLKKAGF